MISVTYAMFIENTLLALNGLSAAIILFKLPFPIVKIYPEEPDLSWLEIINQLKTKFDKYNKGSTEEVSKYLPSELPVGECVYSFYPWGMVKSDMNSNKKVLFESDGLRVLPLLVRDVISQIQSSTEVKISEDWENIIGESLKQTQRRVRNGVYFDTDGQGETEAERKTAVGFSKLYFTPSREAAAHKQYFYIQSITSVLALSWLVLIKPGALWTILWLILNVNSTFSFIKMHTDTECFDDDYDILKNNDFAYRCGSLYWIQLTILLGGWVGMYASLLIELLNF